MKASWNATFSAQEAPRRENAADRRRRWSRPGPGGGGFRRGKQEPLRRRIRKKIRRKIRRPRCTDPTRRPRLGGGLRKAAPWYRRASLLGPQAALGEVLGGGLGRLGGVLGPLGGVLGALGGLLARLGGLLEASWGPLGGILGPLGPSWRHLGGILAHLGGILKIL